jgi:hypothetical protein
VTSPQQARWVSGGRIYTHPATGVEYPAVSTLTKGATGGPPENWFRRVTADVVLDEPERWLRLLDSEGHDETAKAIGRAATFRGKYGVRRGNLLHDAIDEYIGGEARPMFDEGEDAEAAHEARACFGQFLAMLDETGMVVETVGDVSLNEVTLYNLTHRYAGTADAIVRMPNHHGDDLVLVDWKTGNRVYPSVALQLAAYRNAEEITYGTPITVSPMPPIAATYAVHIEAKRWRVIEVETGPEVFARTLDVMRWNHYFRENERRLVGHPVAQGKAGAA